MKTLSIWLLSIILLTFISCSPAILLPLEHVGAFGGKTPGLDPGKGSINGFLYVSEEYDIKSAAIYLSVAGKKYFASRVSPDARQFLLENIPCGHWPAVVEIRRTRANGRAKVRFEGILCVTAQHTDWDTLFIPTRAEFAEPQA